MATLHQNAPRKRLSFRSIPGEEAFEDGSGAALLAVERSSSGRSTASAALRAVLQRA